MIALLMGGNIFFIKRLIDKIDETERIAREASASARSFESTIKRFVRELKSIRQNLTEIHELDKQLGKLEAQMQLLLAKDGYFSGHGE